MHEPLEPRTMFAVTAALSGSELRIGFTSSAVAEQVARLSSDGTNYTVRNTNSISIGTFSVTTVKSISVTGLAAVERFEIPSTSVREITAPLVVTNTVDTSVINRAINSPSGGVSIGSPAITLGASVTTAAAQTYSGQVTIAAGDIATVSTAAGEIRFEDIVKGAAGSVLTMETAAGATLLGGLTGAVRLVKRGAGAMVLPSAGRFAGGTAVEAGELVMQRAGGLGTGDLQIGTAGRVTLEAGTTLSSVARFAMASGGRIDVGACGLRVAAGGYDLDAVRGLLATGHAGGWSGPVGIVSQEAAVTVGRAVGFRVAEDGSLALAFAAHGDTNIDGVIDILDVASILFSTTFDSGQSATWADGDFNYDNVVDILDIADMLVTGLYDEPSYLPVQTVATGFAETWESLSTSTLASSEWHLQTGAWGTIAQQDVRNAGRKHAVAAGQTTRLMRPLDIATQDHVVLQGWFSDGGGATSSTLGLASFPSANDNSLIRMGATGKGTYRIEYYDTGASSPAIEIDTTLAVEAGWHFMRLDLMRDAADPSVWQATWRGWNTEQTVEKKQTFNWRFDAAAVGWTTLGSAAATPGATAWDEIKVGSLGRVGPPPALPVTRPQVIGTASSSLPGWEPSKAMDANSGTVYSSLGHGTNSSATEWVALDIGRMANLTRVTIDPRPLGGACFPVDFEIQSSTDMVSWTTIPGAVFTAQPQPTQALKHTFATPVQARGLRLYATRLRPDGSGVHFLQLADFTAAGFEPADLQAWTSPAELRDKSVNSAGVFSAVNLSSPDAPTPSYLAAHPEYLANHPFDGVTVPVLVDPAWAFAQGLVTEPVYALHQIGMTKAPLTWAAVEPAVNDLKKVAWGHVNDNFLWYGVSDFSFPEDGNVAYAADPTSAADWTVVANNAALSARVCREAGLQGFMMDTEMYTTYASGAVYPFGLGTAATWRARGEEWIKAVQQEFPEIKIQFFFSWGPETESTGWDGYSNLKYFMNGILAGIEAPGRIIHAYENTFWYGQDRVMPDGTTFHYAGDRVPFQQTRSEIRNTWRTFSDDPAKYDAFVDVGMAAGVDSDPYNLYPGWPSGFDINWSNLPHTLAFSDHYVWTWCGHTHYPATSESLNPFLASIANQTFNTGTERVGSFTDDFAVDPMKRGWYFSFNMLDIGRKSDPDSESPSMNTDTVAYAWSTANQAIAVRGDWSRGDFGEIQGLASPQQRRYVRPVEPLTRSTTIHAEIDFTVDTFGIDNDNPILLGLFHSEAATTQQALCLRIDSNSTVNLVVVGDGTGLTLPLPLVAPLETGRAYRATLDYDPARRTVVAVLRDAITSAVVSQTDSVTVAAIGPFVFDEAGIAQREAAIATTSSQAYRFRLNQFNLNAGSRSI